MSVSRDQWGAVPPRPWARDEIAAEQIRGVVLHYSGNEGNPDLQHEQCKQRVAHLQHLHLHALGMADIAYNWVICEHGERFEGRGFDRRPAAQGNGGNDHYYAVLYLGHDKHGRTGVSDEGKQAIRELVDEVDQRHGGARETRLHSEFAATECPGPELAEWVKAGLPAKVAKKAKVQVVDGERRVFPPSWYSRELAPGTKGADVVAAQQLLGVLEDGEFGEGLSIAVREFQRSKHLEADGLIGPLTAEALGERDLKLEDRGLDVSTLQAALKVNVDGVFGEATAKAVRHLQGQAKLPIDGVVNSKTRAALEA